MIFENVKFITENKEFLEKVLLYIRIVEVIAEKNKLNIFPTYSQMDIGTIQEIEDMGIISSEADLTQLKAILKENYFRFISCVNFFLLNKNLYGELLDKLSNKKREIIQANIIKEDRPTFADFFAGAGGLSCGFTQAGYRVCFANDFEEVCVNTYKYNHPELSTNKVFKCDIRKIVDNIEDYITTPIDIVIGGPPCQGFSSANQQRIIDDPRNELYKYYIKAVSKILPKFVLMENVKGMLTVANQVVEDYAHIKVNRDGQTYSYVVAYRILNSVDFAVAQSRERLIFIAIRNDIAKDKNITPQDIFNEIEVNNKSNCHYVLRDALEAIKPLEAPRNKNMNDIDDETTGKKIDFNNFHGNENAYLRLINGNRDIPLLYNHKARYVNDINFEIYRLLNQGDDASDSKIKGIMPYENRLHCFKDKYYKLIADKPSRTITAHLRMDCHSHIHPYQIRAITPREAARCQSFPDDYLFLGAYLKTYMQIGNAVPCLMAKGIANVIKKYL
ncbi:MAG: DNA cytosine methyltransferase [Prevotella sp.]|nr:DNA cytosine methyltransferase [Prevotella sp.]